MISEEMETNAHGAVLRVYSVPTLSEKAAQETLLTHPFINDWQTELFHTAMRSAC